MSYGVVYCEHANESPYPCPCDADCYCRVEGNCKKLASTPAMPLNKPLDQERMSKMLGSTYVMKGNQSPPPPSTRKDWRHYEEVTVDLNEVEAILVVQNEDDLYDVVIWTKSDNEILLENGFDTIAEANEKRKEILKGLGII